MLNFPALGVRDGRGNAHSELIRLVKEQNRARQHGLLEMMITKQMATAVARCSRDFRYLWVNQGYADWIQRPVNEVVYRSISDVLGKEAFDSLLPHFQRVLKGETVQYEQETNFRGIGRRRTSATYTPTFDADGATDGLVVVVLDMTDRKQAEEARSKHAAIVESYEDAIISKDLSGLITSWNIGAERIFGYKEEEVIGCPITILIAPELWEEENKILERLRTGGRIEHYETKRLTKTGKQVDVSLTIGPIRDAIGSVVGFTKIAHDITERKRAERAVTESETRFRLVADTAPVLIWMSGIDKLCTYFNKPWLDFTGRSMEQELGNGWAEGVHPDDLQGCLDAYHQSFDRREKFRTEYRLRHYDGEYRWILDIGVPRFDQDGSFAGYIGCCVDVTDRKQTEETRARYAAIVESSNDAILGLDVSGTVTNWNRGAERLFGYSADEAVGRKVFLLSDADRSEEAQDILRKVLNGKSVKQFETVRRRKDGSRLDISLTVSPILDAAGRVVGVSGIAHDITERKMVEHSLHESEEKFRNVFRDAGVGMVIVSPEGRFLGANNAFCECLGYTEEELLEKTVESITFHEDWPVFSQKLRQAITEERGFQWFEKRCLHKSGRIVYTESSASLIRNHNGEPQYFVGEVLDVTKRKEAEQALSDMTRKLIEAQEKERARIGRELHDDINQRLAMLALELEQLQANPSEMQARLQELRNQTTELSNDVQALSHELHSSKLEYLGVVSGIRSWCKEFGERQKMEIDFKSDVSSVLPPEIGVSLFRVLQESLHNAVKHSGVKHIEVQLREASNEIHLMVTDLGRGFEVEAALQGQGLGLTSMQERVRLLNGSIDIHSKPMGGTTIHVRVPFGSEHATRRAAG